MPIAIDFLCNHPALFSSAGFGNKTRKQNAKYNLSSTPLWRWPTLKKPGHLQVMRFYPGCITYILWVYPAPKWHPQLPGLLEEKEGKKPLQGRAPTLQYLTGRSQEAHGSSQPSTQQSSPALSGFTRCPDIGSSVVLKRKREVEEQLFTPVIALWNLGTDELILTPHSTHSSHMTLPTAPVFAVFTGRRTVQRCSPYCHTESRTSPSGSAPERARLLKPSDRLQMPDFSLSSE